MRFEGDQLEWGRWAKAAARRVRRSLGRGYGGAVFVGRGEVTRRDEVRRREGRRGG